VMISKPDSDTEECLSPPSFGAGSGTVELRLIGPATALCLFCFTLVLHFRLRTLIFDDAFIHLRIARNLQAYGIAFFNPGERVLTTSSPLWTTLLAVLKVPGHLWLLPLIEATSLTACGVLTYLLCLKVLTESVPAIRQVIGRIPPIAVHAIIFAGTAATLAMLIVLPSALGQMETPLAMALLLGSAFLFVQGRATGLIPLALASCTRLEHLPLFFASWIVAAAFHARRAALFASLGIMLGFALATYAQFGMFLPNSMRAKSIGYGYFRMDIVRQLFDIPFLEIPLLCCLSVFLISMIADKVFCFRLLKHSRSIPVPAIAGLWALVVMAEYVTRHTPIFEWYKPIIFLPMLLCFLLYRAASSAWLPLRAALELARLFGIVLLILVPAWKGAETVKAAAQNTAIPRFSADHGDSGRVQEYLVVGRVLHETCPSGVLMTPEIGTLGWAYQGYISDAFGIATPRALVFQPLHSGAPVGGVPAKFAAELLPDIIVSYTALDVEVRADAVLMYEYDLVQLPVALSGYRGISGQPGWHDSTHLDVMLRKGGVCPIPAVETALYAAMQ